MASVDISVNNNMNGFELIQSLKYEEIPIDKYKSSNTGLTVVIANVHGPIVSGYLCLLTEALDDDGLPHTLEHLIFMGSENYPYKGILDLLANRCLASGTNACTDIDNTFYTMETVGSEGFLTLLPIYLDHILYPILKNSAFNTEVHHITGTGEDAGIVYCEMQGKENVGEILAYHELRKAIYPGNCGYKSNTGGALKNLRESTNNEKVRKYHKDYYRSENLNIIIVGKINHTDVFKALQPIEEKVLAKGNRGPFTRPWQNVVPPLVKSVEQNIYYPCSSEDNGLVYIGWRGPPAKSQYELLGCGLLLKYLTDTSVSFLQKKFVEIEEPYASDVKFSLSENTESFLYLTFENVPLDKISEISTYLTFVLENMYADENGIDMERMCTVIYRHICDICIHLEKNTHDTIAYLIIGDFLFGNSKEDFDTRLNEVKNLKKFQNEPLSYWKKLLKKYFIEAPSVVIKGIPSIKRQEELIDMEQKRITEQIKSLGIEGLKEKNQELRKSIVENETPIPNDILTSIPIPNTDSINFHTIRFTSTENIDKNFNFNICEVPFYTYINDINTNFVYMFVIMDTSEVPLNQRPYIPLILESILESPVLRDGKLIPYETIVSELEKDTISINTGLGIKSSSRFNCGTYSHSAIFALQLSITNYPKGITWVKELLYSSQFIPKRLKVIASKIINDVAQMKRKGKKIVDDLIKSIIYKKDSNHFITSMLRQQKFLSKMLKQLSTEIGEKDVLNEIEFVRNILTKTMNMALYIAADLHKLNLQAGDIYTPWTEFPNFDSSIKKKLHVVPDHELMNPLSEIYLNGCVVAIGFIESAFLSQCCSSINNYLNSDLAPLLVCLQYFTQMEGPLWRQIRGQGFAYSYDMYVKPNEGKLYLTFSKATNIVGAYKETKNIIDCHLNKNEWDILFFESAKSSLIFEFVQAQRSVGDTIFKSLLQIFQGMPNDYNQRMVQNISIVTIKDIERVASVYIKPLFDASTCKTAIVCCPSKSGEIIKLFKELGHDLKLYDGIENSILNSW